MAEAEVECSLCPSICSRICYLGHKDWYACHNIECALHYPENVEIGEDDRFVLGGGGGGYHPRQDDESGLVEYRRPRLRDALRTLFCGLSRSRSSSPDWEAYSPPRRNQRSWSPDHGPASQHNTPASRHNTTSSRHVGPPSRYDGPPSQHDGPSSQHNTPPPQNTSGPIRIIRTLRSTRRPARERNDSDDEIHTHTSSIGLPRLTRQENSRRGLYQDTAGFMRYTILLERQADAQMNLRSVTRDGELL